MSRLLFFAAIAAVVYWLLSSYRKRETRDENTSMRAEDMVRCAHCGVHFPRREGILSGGNFYCSEAHRRAHADKVG